MIRTSVTLRVSRVRTLLGSDDRLSLVFLANSNCIIIVVPRWGASFGFVTNTIVFELIVTWLFRGVALCWFFNELRILG